MRAIRILALEHPHAVARADEPDLVARVARVEHLVAGLDGADLRPDRGDDAGRALRGLVDRDDQPRCRLGLVERLDTR